MCFSTDKKTLADRTESNAVNKTAVKGLKVGDSVRVNKGDAAGYLKEGLQTNVTAVSRFGVTVQVAGVSGWWNDTRFELVNEAIDLTPKKPGAFSGPKTADILAYLNGKTLGRTAREIADGIDADARQTSKRISEQVKKGKIVILDQDNARNAKTFALAA